MFNQKRQQVLNATTMLRVQFKFGQTEHGWTLGSRKTTASFAGPQTRIVLSTAGQFGRVQLDSARTGSRWLPPVGRPDYSQ